MKIKRREYQVENPDRLSVLLEPCMGILQSDFFKNRCDFEVTKEDAKLADILRVHDFNYIDSVRNTCEDLKANNKHKMYKYDSDTYINQHTWESATFAAGTVIHAVDRVMSGDYKNALCLVRPPGHHAGYYGKVDSPEETCRSSNGFCFINNVAVGAAYCKYKWREKVKKIAILDFDVHHGNGTQEIIKMLQKSSLNIKTENKICSVNLTKTVFNPWLDYDDAQNVLLISLHGYDEDFPGSFYPSSGGYEENTKKDSPIYPGGILNVPVVKSNAFSHRYRKLFRAKVIPRLMKFQPDVIFISAGFDGHENEHINLAYMKLNEYDYRWITEEVMKIAKVYCNDRVISVLEGGYNINSGPVSSFAQSVFSHSQFLNIGLNKSREESFNLSKLKRMREYDREFANYKLYKKFKNQESDENENENEEIFDKKRLRNRAKNNLELDEQMVGQTPPKTPIVSNYDKSFKELRMENLLDENQAEYRDNFKLTGDYNMFSFDPRSKDMKDNEEDNELFIKFCHNEDEKSSHQTYTNKNTDTNKYFLPGPDINNKFNDNAGKKTNAENDDEIEVELDDEL